MVSREHEQPAQAGHGRRSRGTGRPGGRGGAGDRRCAKCPIIRISYKRHTRLIWSGMKRFGEKRAIYLATDIENEPAGPRLDSWIAEKVMGGDVGLREIGIHRSQVGYGWSPSIDIAAAWGVVEKLSGFSIGKSAGDGTWICSCYGAVAGGDTAPLAICRAALKGKNRCRS